MCPLWPFHFLFTYIAILVPLWILSFRTIGIAADTSGRKWTFFYEPSNVRELMVENTLTVKVRTDYWDAAAQGSQLELKVLDENIASVFPTKLPWSEIAKTNSPSANGHGTNITSDVSYTEVEFNITGKFLGYTKVCPKLLHTSPGNVSVQTAQDSLGTAKASTENCLDVAVIRKPSGYDKLFHASIGILVSLMYVNMGAALDLPTIKETLKKPYGPMIGLFSQFVIMPLLSYGLARAFIPLAALQLGLFMTGCSPGGGASNIWTLCLGGNMDLSITMTTISTLTAFAMMPAWVFTLGSTILAEANLTIPYSKIAMFAVALIGPLSFGLVIQRCSPKIAKWLVRASKPFSFFLIVYIVVFACYLNMYIFQLLTWEILASGFLLPHLGYLLGGGLACLFKRDLEDVIAISIETGIQNTGLAIFALRFSLPQPEADLTTVLPVAVAIMTPLLPTIVFLVQKIRERRLNSGFTLAHKEEDSSATPSPSV